MDPTVTIATPVWGYEIWANRSCVLPPATCTPEEQARLRPARSRPAPPPCVGPARPHCAHRSCAPAQRYDAVGAFELKRAGRAPHGADEVWLPYVKCCATDSCNAAALDAAPARGLLWAIAAAWIGLAFC